AQTRGRPPSQARVDALRAARAHAHIDRGYRHRGHVPHALPAARLGPFAPSLAEIAQRIVDFAACGALVRVRLRYRAVLTMDLQVDLLAEDRNLLRRLNPDSNLLAHDRKHRDLNVVADHDALVGLARQNQHSVHLPVGRSPDATPPTAGARSIVPVPGE